MATSAPPPVNFLTSATTSPSVVEDHVGAHLLRHREPRLVAVDADDQAGAHERAPAVAQRPIGPWAKTTTVSPRLTSAGLGPAEAGGGDVGQQDDLLVGQVVRDFGQVGLGVRDEQVLGLGPVDRVPEPPAADRLVPVAVPALGQVARQTGVALAARRDRPDQHPVAGLVAGDAGAELLDDADRLMPDDQARPDRVLAADDVQVGPADGGQRDPDGAASPGPGGAAVDLLDADVVRAMEDGRAHRGRIGHYPLGGWRLLKWSCHVSLATCEFPRR